jgi:hypothetical protein
MPGCQSPVGLLETIFLGQASFLKIGYFFIFKPPFFTYSKLAAAQVRSEIAVREAEIEFPEVPPPDEEEEKEEILKKEKIKKEDEKPVKKGTPA